MSDGQPEADSLRAVLAETLRGGPLALLLPLAAAALLLGLPLLSGDAYWMRQISLVAVTALAVSGLNLTFGFAGEFQFAQVLEFAVGCYLTMILATHGWNDVAALVLIGGTAAAAAAAPLALLGHRASGWPLALTSFFLVVTIPDVVGIFQTQTSVLNRLDNIPNPRLLGYTLGSAGLYEVTIVTLIGWFAVYRNLVTSRYGIGFLNLRHSAALATSLGSSTLRLKVAAYTVGAVPAGMGGCLFGFITLIVTPSAFDFSLAVAIVAASMLGGTESVYGALIGAALLQLGPQTSLSFQRYAPIAYGLFIVLAASVFRRGLSHAAKALAVRLSFVVAGTESVGQNLKTFSTHPAATAPYGVHSLALHVRSVSKSFGAVHALNGVSLIANPGQVTALLGSNGSGKTTLLNMICGFSHHDRTGSVSLGDDRLSGQPAHLIARAGVARTFQTPAIPRGVTVLDAVCAGRFSLDPTGIVSCMLRLPRFWRARQSDRLVALSVLELVGLADVADREAARQPLATRRLVEVARALCARPRLLLLDEPAAGLTGPELDRLGAIIRSVARAGAVVVLVEHNLRFVEQVADVSHVLHLGTIIASGPPTEVTLDTTVIASYLGAPTERTAVTLPPRGTRRTTAATGRLEIIDVHSGYEDLRVLRGLSMTLKPGSIEVVLGRNGAGKSTLLATIIGLVRQHEGSILLDGEDITRLPTHRRAAAGLTLVQEGRRIFRERTVLENIELGTATRRMSRRARAARCAETLELFPALAARPSDPAGALSGGQQQMLALGQALAAAPKVILLDEPSTGLSPPVASELFRVVRALADAGTSVLLVEQSAVHTITIADHVTVIDNGRVTAAGPPEEFRNLNHRRGSYFGTV